MILGFKILRLFMMNKWWLTSRTNQNRTRNIKNFTIFPQRNRCWENVFSASENAEIDQFFHDVEIQILEVIYEEQMMAHIQNNKKHVFELYIFQHFSSYLQRNRRWENLFSASENAEKVQFFHVVGIQNFEDIYVEQVMAHIQKHTKHVFET
jgi:hypothetical protein